MTAGLFGKTGHFSGAEFGIVERATIGRNQHHPIVLEANGVSGDHACIWWDKERGCYVLEDTESLNGTMLDGVPVTRRQRLSELHVITFGGEHDLIFHWDGSPPSEVASASEPEPRVIPAAFAPQASTPQEPADGTIVASAAALDMPAFETPADDPPTPDAAEAGTPIYAAAELEVPELDRRAEQTVALGAGPGNIRESIETASSVWLEVLEPASLVSRYQLVPGDNLVGRTPDCNIWINVPAMSRRHAVLSFRPDGVYVKDLGSTNKTYVNGKKVSGDVHVTPPASLRFGDIECRLTHRIEGDRVPTRLT